MKHRLKLFIAALIGILVFNNSAFSQKKIVGYYESWSGLKISNIEFNNITHVIHAFAWPDTDGSIGMSYKVPDSDLVSAVHKASKKILISFTNDSTDGFSKILKDSRIRAVFVSNAVKFLSTNNYDGIDFDWEYPTLAQSDSLTELIKELRKKFDLVNTAWQISMAIPPNWYYGQYYKCENMISYVNWFSVMAYNYHGAWYTHSGHDAPLYESGNDNDGNVSNSIQYWTVTRNIPAAKLLLGVPFYGLEFNSKGLYQPSDTSVHIVPTILYADLIDTVSSGKWIYNWDSVAEVPYYIKNDSTRFITFDDTSSIRLKTEYSISQKLGGIMIWALGFDGLNSSQPLLETISKTIKDNPTAVVSDKKKSINPSLIYLYDNYPNPFNPSTTISWQIPKESFVTLKIYDVLGHEVATLVNEYQKAGGHSIVFDTQKIAGDKQLASGVYIYKLTAGGLASTKKFMLMK
jgi:chitinase